MKKITESELINLARGLQKYLGEAGMTPIKDPVNGQNVYPGSPRYAELQKATPKVNPANLLDPAQLQSGNPKVNAAPTAAPTAAPKADAPKADAPKADAPKADAPAPKKEWGKGVLGMGSRGPAVGDLQDKLGIKRDEIFGKETRDAVIAKQKELGVNPDGAWGPATQKAFDAKAPVAADPTASSGTGLKMPAAPAAAPADPVQAARDRVTQYDQDKQAVADDDFKKKYGNLGRDQQIRQTGNMKKPWTELKQGDVDYDDRGVKHVYQAGADGGPGQWNASWGGDSKSGNWSDEPGLGLIGPKASSPEGQKYLAARQARVMTPQQAADYDRLYPEQPAQQQESVGFQNDELNRIVSLVHYR